MNLALLQEVPVVGLMSFVAGCVCVTSCTRSNPLRKDVEGLRQFQGAGPSECGLDVPDSIQAATPEGLYRAVHGDVSSIRLSNGSSSVLPRRVGDDRTIKLSLRDKVAVRANALAELEDQTSQARHPGMHSVSPGVIGLVGQSGTSSVRSATKMGSIHSLGRHG